MRFIGFSLSMGFFIKFFTGGEIITSYFSSRIRRIMNSRSHCLFAATAAALKFHDFSDSDKKNINNFGDYWFNQKSLSDFKHRMTQIVSRFKERSGCPGIVAAVSVSGKLIYCAGLGYADVERLVPAHPNTVFRIASISKSLTSLLVGRMLEQGKMTLDEDVRSYVPEFPKKSYGGSYAKITIRSLLNHTSGIRSYKKSEQSGHWPEYPEMLLQTHYDNPAEACKLFADDDLLHAPGQKYFYSTYAFTLLAAAIERACSLTSPVFDGIPTRNVSGSVERTDSKDRPATLWHCRIETQLAYLFSRLGLHDTYLDRNENIIPMRSSQYRRDSGVLKNTPMVDNSYKWAGGGVLSTAPDLLRFANHLSFIYLDRLSSQSIVSHHTLKQLWTVSATNPESLWQPGLGWFISRRSGVPVDQKPTCPDRLYVGHTGGAVGGTTVLLMSLPCCSLFVDHFAHKPTNTYPNIDWTISELPPICVVVLTNLENVSGISDLAVSLAELTTDYLTKCIPPEVCLLDL